MRAIPLSILAACAACGGRGGSPPVGRDAAPARPAPARLDAAPPAKNATGFEDTSWGMSAQELEARYGKERTAGTVARFASPTEPLIIHRNLDGLPVEIGLILGDAGLRAIDISSLRSYGEEDDDCDVDESTLEGWIARTVGKPDERRAGSAKWRTATSEILVYCDEDLGASYQPHR